MNVAEVKLDPTTAAGLYREYQQHRAKWTKEDGEIAAIYRQISKGKKVIQAFESIRAAGVDEMGRPRLAIVRADVRECIGRFHNANEVAFRDREYMGWGPRSPRLIEMPWPGFRPLSASRSYRAMVPLIPIQHRPATDQLTKYHILWEADWAAVPVDPMLLRRIGGDAWLVVAAWDLTPVERAVLASRLGGR